MGAYKDLGLRKCGDIIINMNTARNKTKLYTFRCSFCSTDCDQLKKFSKHLEEHLHNLEDELEGLPEQQSVPLVIFEPEEIKVEPQIDTENLDDIKRIACTSACANVFEDPLDERKIHKNKINEVSDKEELAITIIKGTDGNSCDNDNNNIEFESFANSNYTADIDEIQLSKKNKSSFSGTHQNDFISDSSSDELEDDDFKIENNLINLRKRKKSKTETVEKGATASTKHRRCKKRWKSIDQSKLPLLIDMYKKYEVLWHVNDIAFGILQKRKETFGKMIEELKSNHNFDKNLDELQDHIDYINHIFYKDREQELKCELDKTKFTPTSKYYNDLLFLSDSQGPFKCANCNEIIGKYDLYHIHVAQHNGTQPFKCKLCEKGFQKFSYYLCHVTRHLGINSYHCHVCGKGYPLKPELDWHLTSHTGVKPYLCPICGEGFRARHTFDNHIRRHENRFRYECHICKHGFNHLGKLNIHIKSHLNIRDVICNVCGKGFTATKYLKRHKLIHDDEKTFKCKVCGKAFAQDSGLRAHRKQHQPYATEAENKNLLKGFCLSK